MGTFCVTGAANGMGAATKRQLEAAGHRVIGVDLRGSDIDADLGTADGRAAAVAEVLARCDGRLDGLAPIAGINGTIGPEPTVRINYFGAIGVVEGLHDALAASGNAAVVLIASVATTMTPGLTREHADLFLGGDEQGAVDAMASQGWYAYPAGKLAIAYWVRSHAVLPRWIGQGIRINAVAPGVIDTNMTRSLHDIEGMDEALAQIPMPIGRQGTADELANVITFLLGRQSSYVVGQTWFVDGGTDAAIQPRSAPNPLG